MTACNSDLARRYAPRVLALVGQCPEGATQKVRDGQRLAQCTRTGANAELTVKMGLRSDVSGAALLHARFRIVFGAGGAASLSLHHLEGRRETDGLTRRQEQYLAALLTWVEQALPATVPTPSGTRTPTWQRAYADLYALLSGGSTATARRRLREAWFVDQEDAAEPARMDAFLDLMREEGRVAMVDWREETIDALTADVVRRRLPERPALWADRTALAAAGYAVAMLDDGSDGSAIAVIATDQVEMLRTLLARLGVHVTVRL